MHVGLERNTETKQVHVQDYVTSPECRTKS